MAGQKLGTVSLCLAEKVTEHSLPGKLTIFIHSATNLEPQDLNGLSDPYCIFTVSDSKGFSIRPEFRTKVINSNLNPIWDPKCMDRQTLVVHDGSIMLTFQVWDKDLLSRDDFEGEVSFKAQDLIVLMQHDSPLQEFSFRLQPRPGKKEKVRGTIQLRASWFSDPWKSFLDRQAVMSTINLSKMDAINTSKQRQQELENMMKARINRDFHHNEESLRFWKQGIDTVLAKLLEPPECPSRLVVSPQNLGGLTPETINNLVTHIGKSPSLRSLALKGVSLGTFSPTLNPVSITALSLEDCYGIESDAESLAISNLFRTREKGLTKLEVFPLRKGCNPLWIPNLLNALCYRSELQFLTLSSFIITSEISKAISTLLRTSKSIHTFRLGILISGNQEEDSQVIAELVSTILPAVKEHSTLTEFSLQFKDTTASKSSFLLSQIYSNSTLDLNSLMNNNVGNPMPSPRNSTDSQSPSPSPSPGSSLSPSPGDNILLTPKSSLRSSDGRSSTLPTISDQSSITLLGILCDIILYSPSLTTLRISGLSVDPDVAKALGTSIRANKQITTFKCSGMTSAAIRSFLEASGLVAMAMAIVGGDSSVLTKSMAMESTMSGPSPLVCSLQELDFSNPSGTISTQVHALLMELMEVFNLLVIFIGEREYISD